MTKHKTKNKKNKNIAKRVILYIFSSLILFSLAYFGSRDKFLKQSSSVDMRVLAQNNFTASADQIIAMYAVSELAEEMSLSSAPVMRTNYDTLTTVKEIVSSGSTTRLEKPNIANEEHLAVGVIEYTVKDGETIATIAAKYAKNGVNETMIRWSNHLKNSATVNAGQKIFIPSRAGIIYKVKKDESIDFIARKYKSSVEEIISANSLELNEKISEGMVIMIPEGELPATERPDYVPPVINRFYTSYSPAYSSGNRYAYGYCTWYVWSERAKLGYKYLLPGNLGHARTWAERAAAAGFKVSRTPQSGDVFQTKSGYYGHVGMVEAVHADGSITVSDMNGIAGWGRVGRQVWSRAKWQGYIFIHSR